jgi:Secreted repeat of unknown function
MVEKTRRAGLNWQRIGLRLAGGRAARRDRGDSPGPVPDRLPVDPGDRLAFPAPGDRRLRPRRGRAGVRQPAGRHGRCRVCPLDPRRLPPVGVDRRGPWRPAAACWPGCRRACQVPNCNGTCAGYWPPATGTPAAGPGVTGKLSTIKRSDGTTQAVYNGHPLYTYVGDTASGQAHGNNLNLNGGLWHEVTVSG